MALLPDTLRESEGNTCVPPRFWLKPSSGFSISPWSDFTFPSLCSWSSEFMPRPENIHCITGNLCRRKETYAKDFSFLLWHPNSQGTLQRVTRPLCIPKAFLVFQGKTHKEHPVKTEVAVGKRKDGVSMLRKQDTGGDWSWWGGGDPLFLGSES